MTDNSALVYNLYANQTVRTYAINGTGSVTSMGGSMLTLANNNSYSGGTIVSGGTLQLGASAALGSSGGPLTVNGTVNGAVLDLNSFSPSAGAVTLAAGTIVDNSGTPGTLTAASYNLQSGTAAVVLAGNSAALTKTTAGLALLTAANTYGGGTTVSAGSLVLGPAATLGSGNITVAPGALLDVSAYGSSGYNFGPGVLTAGRTFLPATDINGSLNLNNATLSPAGAGTVGTLTLNGNLAINGGTLAYDSGDQVAVSGALSLTGIEYVIPNSALTSGTYNLFTYTGGLTGSTGDLAMAGAFGSNPRQTYSFGVSGGTAITLSVTGLAGNLQWSGGSNSTWDAGVSKNWFNLSTSTADYFYTGDNVTFNDTPGTANSVIVSGSVQPGTLTFGNNLVNYTLSGSGSIVGSTSLVMNGVGTVTIATSNSYAGGTAVNSGVLNANAASALGSGTVGVSGGVLNANAAQALPAAALSISSGTVNINAPQSPASVTLGNGLLNLANSAAIGSGLLTINGGTLDNTSGGPMTLSGNNPQSWNGSFVFNGSSSLNMGNGAVTMNASPTVYVAANTLTVGGVISGAGALTKNGGGTLVLSGNNSYAGGTSIANGVLNISADASLGSPTGTVTFTGNGTLQAGANNISLVSARPVVLNSGVTGTIDTQGNNMTITGVISGAGGLTEIGGGNLTLTANDTFSGATTVSGGTLTITGNGGAAGVLPNTAITVAAGGTLVLNGQDVLGYNNTNLLTVYGTLDKVYNQSETVYQPILLSGGTMTSSGTFGTPNGAWDWFGGNISTAFGTTNFINGTGNFSLRSAAAYLNLGAGSTLNISVPITQNTNSGGTPLNVEGAGTLILSGTNTYTQPMQVGYNSTAGNLEFQGISVSSFTATGDGEFNLAYGSTLYISGSASVTLASDLKLGANASGSAGNVVQSGGVLTITDSATGRPLTIGEYPGETSTYTLTGGVLNVPNSWTYLPWNGGANLNISGGTANLLGINLGNGSASALNLSGSGALFLGSLGIAKNNNATTTTLSGGTLGAYASWSTAEPMTLSGSATINPQGFTIGLSGALTGFGTLTLGGPGTLLLSSSNNSYGGGTTLLAGTLQVANTAALVRAGDPGRWSAHLQRPRFVRASQSAGPQRQRLAGRPDQ